MIIFNEKEFAENCIKSEELHVYKVQEMIVICKYLRSIPFKNHSNPEPLIKSTLTYILEKQNPNFNADVYYKKINFAIKTSLKLELRSCLPVQISNKEWQIITSIPLKEAQKVLFTMLVVAKFNRMNPYKQPNTYEDTRLRCNISLTEILKISKVSKTKLSEIYPLYSDLLELINSRTVRRILLFAELEPVNNPFLTIYDYDNLIQYYNMQFDDSIKECSHCHKIFKTTTTHKLCAKCRNNQEIKKYICQDCGKICEFKARQKTEQTRCGSCYEKFRKQYKAKIEKKRRSGQIT